MNMTIGIPGSSATIKVATVDGHVLLHPQGFDREDPSHIQALASAMSMLKDASIDLPMGDELHQKVALISIPGGNEQQQQGTTPPPASGAVQEAGGVQALMAQVQQMQQRIDALEQAMGGPQAAPPAAGGQPPAPPAPGGAAPPPPPPAPRGAPQEMAPMGPGLGG